MSYLMDDRGAERWIPWLYWLRSGIQPRWYSRETRRELRGEIRDPRALLRTCSAAFFFIAVYIVGAQLGYSALLRVIAGMKGLAPDGLRLFLFLVGGLGGVFALFWIASWPMRCIVQDRRLRIGRRLRICPVCDYPLAAILPDPDGCKHAPSVDQDGDCPGSGFGHEALDRNDPTETRTGAR